MVVHPPMLYMGYVGFSVAFAFAIAALIGGHLDAAWARWSRPWTTVAWSFLTIGIMMGSVWAYYELGWGGWWFWDPVENASFMPWLVGTALIHSLAVTEKRGTFRSWTVLLAIIAFSLVAASGTFLVRSGVLTSVHAFATDPARGIFILAFLAIVIGGSLALYAVRAAAVGGGGGFALVSRESMLLGEQHPAGHRDGDACCSARSIRCCIDALGLGKISVGPPYFNAVFYPLMAPLVFLLGIGPLARLAQGERAGSVDEAAMGALRRTRRRRAAAVRNGAVEAAGRARPAAGGMDRGGDGDGVPAAPARGAPQRGFVDKLRANAPAWYGMLIAHLGVAVFIVGVTLVKGYEVERDVRLDVGQSIDIAGDTYTFRGVAPRAGPNYDAHASPRSTSRATAGPWPCCKPQKRAYRASGQAMTEASIQPRIPRRSLRVAGRAGQRGGRVGGMGRAHLREAVRRLDLGRLPADGARRILRGSRSALPPGRARARECGIRRDVGRVRWRPR